MTARGILKISTWVPAPEPHWCVPYRSFDGTLLAVVEVNARTQAVSLTVEERATLLEQIERLATTGHATARVAHPHPTDGVG